MARPVDDSPAAASGERIAKLLARAGIASRREVERMIAEGRIALDGTLVGTPATVLPSLAGVTVDGQAVEAPAPARLFLYHKPPGLLVTEKDPRGRATIYDRLPEDLPRVVPVGRLDLATEGLLLLTTDGGFKRQLELPATGVERAYRARAYGEVTQAMLESLSEGVEIEGVRYGSIDANLERRTGANVWIELILTEGKNREVRRVLEYLGLQVSRLIRTRYGPFVLGDLAAGEVGEVKRSDLVGFRATLKGGNPEEPIADEAASRPGFRTRATTDRTRRARPASTHSANARPAGAAGAAPRSGERPARGLPVEAARAALRTGGATVGGRDRPARPDAKATSADQPRDAHAPPDQRRAQAPRRQGADENAGPRSAPRAARGSTSRDGQGPARDAERTIGSARGERLKRPSANPDRLRDPASSRDARSKRTSRHSDAATPAVAGFRSPPRTDRAARPARHRTDRARDDAPFAPLRATTPAEPSGRRAARTRPTHDATDGDVPRGTTPRASRGGDGARPAGFSRSGDKASASPGAGGSTGRRSGGKPPFAPRPGSDPTTTPRRGGKPPSPSASGGGRKGPPRGKR